MGTHINTWGTDHHQAPNHRGYTAATALRTLLARIDTLPTPGNEGFVTAAGQVLRELRTLDMTNTANADLGDPASILTISAIRRTYTVLLGRVAQSPHATLGQRLAAARQDAELTSFEAAGACGIPLDVVLRAEADLPIPSAAATALRSLVDQLSKAMAVASPAA